MTNKTSIIFDFGGVLGSDANSWSKDEAAQQYTGLSESEINELFFYHWPELRIGTIDLQIFFEAVAEKSKKDVSINTLREHYHHTIVINQAVMEFATKLSENHKLFILANESLEGMSVKIKKFNLNKHFIKIFNSAELGLAKPNAEIYKKVLEIIDSSPEETIYIDDQEKNIKAANKLDIKSNLFTDLQTLLHDLSEKQ